jgi:hypothetical protein
VRGAAELHPPEQSPDSQPRSPQRLAFGAAEGRRQHPVSKNLSRKRTPEGYRALRITTARRTTDAALAKSSARIYFATANHRSIDIGHGPAPLAPVRVNDASRPRARSRTSIAPIGAC